MKPSGRFFLAQPRETLPGPTRQMTGCRKHPRPGVNAMPHGSPDVAPGCPRPRLRAMPRKLPDAAPGSFRARR